MSAWNDPELLKLFLDRTPLIDVRAPVEFKAGSVPGAINLPIMADEERALVGTCYKERGQAEAIKLGHELVGGNIKAQRIERWCEKLQKEPRTQIFCFRGGLRSQISCQWISETGIQRSPIKGGYKRMRSFFLSKLDEGPLPELIRLSGLTGAGKTEVLNRFEKALDLEALAHHRGSAFGDLGTQPTQIDFENHLALRLIELQRSAVVEDESAVIGKLTIPRRLFLMMRQSPIIVLRSSEEERLQNIFQGYVLKTSDAQLRNSLAKIERALGGLRYQEVSLELDKALTQARTLAVHERWISLLLHYYYDPLYQRGLERQRDHIKFEGNASEVVEYISSNFAVR